MKYGMKVCDVCKKNYQPRSGNQKACSRECSRQATIQKKRQWRKDNPEKKAAERKDWRKRNPDYDRNWYADNKEKCNETHRRYRARAQEQINERVREYYKKHPEKKKEHKRRGDEQFKIPRQQILEEQKYVCLFCGLDLHKNALDIDHIHPVAEQASYDGEDIHERVNLRALCVECHKLRHRENWL